VRHVQSAASKQRVASAMADLIALEAIGPERDAAQYRDLGVAEGERDRLPGISASSRTKICRRRSSQNGDRLSSGRINFFGEAALARKPPPSKFAAGVVFLQLGERESIKAPSLHANRSYSVL